MGDIPIGCLDVPTGADVNKKRELVKAMYDAMHEAWPFPDDTRIFLREWPLDSVSQNGQLDSEPARPVFLMHVPEGVRADVKRRMFTKIYAAVADVYPLPDIMVFMQEHPLDRVAVNGGMLADDQQRVDDPRDAYS